MNEGQVFLASNATMFNPEDYATVQSLINDKGLRPIYFKTPLIAWLLSFFMGSLGIDRFYIGDWGKGILKLLTFGGFGIWWFIDLFLIMSATRSKNLRNFLDIYAMLPKQLSI